MRSILMAVLLLGSFATAQAAPPYAYPGFSGQAPQQQVPGPGAIVKEGMSRLMSFLRQDPPPSAADLEAFVNSVAAPYFDFDYMAKAIAGKRYRAMSEQERAKFRDRIKTTFLGAMVQKLARYSNQAVRVLSPRRGRAGDVTVGVAILDPRGYPSRLDFRFYRSGDDWKVFDVSANGRSAVIHYRQEFNRKRVSYPRYPRIP